MIAADRVGSTRLALGTQDATLSGRVLKYSLIHAHHLRDQRSACAAAEGLAF